jgi:hypothetical protein
MNAFCQEKVENNRKNKNKQKQPAGFEVEKQTNRKQKGIPQQTTAVDKAKSRQNKGEKRPEVKLRKQQRSVCVEKKYFL